LQQAYDDLVKHINYIYRKKIWYTMLEQVKQLHNATTHTHTHTRANTLNERNGKDTREREQPEARQRTRAHTQSDSREGKPSPCRVPVCCAVSLCVLVPDALRVGRLRNDHDRDSGIRSLLQAVDVGSLTGGSNRSRNNTRTHSHILSSSFRFLFPLPFRFRVSASRHFFFPLCVGILLLALEAA
jgi:hypothetical protein